MREYPKSNRTGFSLMSRNIIKILAVAKANIRGRFQSREKVWLSTE
jgi:hypothetical protein